jgi:hypothetical protein
MVKKYFVVMFFCILGGYLLFLIVLSSMQWMFSGLTVEDPISLLVDLLGVGLYVVALIIPYRMWLKDRKDRRLSELKVKIRDREMEYRDDLDAFKEKWNEKKNTTHLGSYSTERFINGLNKNLYDLHFIPKSINIKEILELYSELLVKWNRNWQKLHQDILNEELCLEDKKQIFKELYSDLVEYLAVLDSVKMDRNEFRKALKKKEIECTYIDKIESMIYDFREWYHENIRNKEGKFVF